MNASFDSDCETSHTGWHPEGSRITIVRVPAPEELTDEVLIKVRCVSLNYCDTEVIMGLYGHHRSINQGKNAPILCSDICGTVANVGTVNAEVLKEGDRVVSVIRFPAADRVPHLPATGLVKAPGYLTDEEAIGLPIAAVTALMSINAFQPIGQSMTGKDKVVLSTSSSDAKLEKARELVAGHTINYKTTPGWQETVLSITNGKGADIIFECGGAQTLENCIGYLSGKEAAAGVNANRNVPALARNVSLKGISNGPKVRFEEILNTYKGKEVNPPVLDCVFGFGDAKEALKYLFSGGHFGKVVV
ncbi:uncharacterized protein BCR38DRAFT_461102 [Pseudomassariella vexata]|uniref:Enoyl reductase (ER) domain-containing protein n=1 Tax=Pseudomassariella vexata TaxID=1141098 RepID=A0A1Y2DEX6_9PEZI|nr:uncharacterized protein BCR38DRAFT_461102 [Pseudomassariella vexata]ORY57833.1 hypothetical protein BCR38DRAFT_461102 [Pseudomassariella vexata]